jgi:hypothetical protein
MLKEVKCLSCQVTLYRIGPLDDKGTMWGLFEDDQDRYNAMRKGQPEKEYLECPQCHKKNWIAGRRVKGKGLQEWISHVTE